MATISNDQVEVLARQLLWKQIDRSAWFAGMSENARTAAIEADVEQWWQLKVGEAAQILVENLIQQGGGEAEHEPPSSDVGSPCMVP